MEFFGFELRQLQFFVTVAEQNSFSRAAELLFVTQPLVSQQIADLEQQLGVELFVRQHHALRLSAAGAALYPEARSILEQSGALIQKVQSSGQIASAGSLRVGIEELFDWPYVINPLKQLRQKNPQITWEISHGNYQSLIHKLFNEKLDVVFALVPNKSLSPKLRVRLIGSSSLCIAVEKTKVRDLPRSEFFAQMDHHPMYLLNGDYRGINCAIRVCAALNVSPQFYFLDNMQNILLNVAAGNGFALLPQPIFEMYGGDMLRVEEFSEYTDSELCLAALWVSASCNPLLPQFLDLFPAGKRDCQTCKQACAVCKVHLNED